MTLPEADRPDLGLDARAEHSLTLPAWTYTDPAWFEREKAAIFYRSWQVLGHVAQLALPGSYVTGWVADQQVVVIRGRDGMLRGFYNVCQHRAHELLQGSGRCSAIVCPYHAWRYDLAGRLTSARGAEAMPGFERAAFSLAPVRVETVHGVVFVNLDETAPALAELAPALAAELAQHVPDLPRYQLYGARSFPQAINWKTLIDNALECYHCETAHPGFCRMVDLADYELVQLPAYSRQIGACRDGQGGPAGHYVYWQMFPLTELRFVTADAAFALFRHRPRAVEQLDMEIMVFGPEGPDDAARAALVEAWANTDFVREDLALCASVQRGLHSRGYRQGRFVVAAGYRSEQLVHDFHLRVAAALGLPVGKAGEPAALAGQAVVRGMARQ